MISAAAFLCITQIAYGSSKVEVTFSYDDERMPVKGVISTGKARKSFEVSALYIYSVSQSRMSDNWTLIIITVTTAQFPFASGFLVSPDGKVIKQAVDWVYSGQHQIEKGILSESSIARRMSVKGFLPDDYVTRKWAYNSKTHKMLPGKWVKEKN